MIRATVGLVCGAIAFGSVLSASPVTAQQAPGGFVDFSFVGTVEYSRGSTISVRNPDGSFTSINSASIPAYLYEPGATLTTTFRFDSAAPAFSNSACGGRFTLVAAGAGGACSVETQVITPFGAIGYGGSGGDSMPSIIGLDLLRNAATGQYSVDMPGGAYAFRYVGVNPYNYDSATKALSGPTANRCVDTFNCPAGSGGGTFDLLSFLIPIAGDFGLVRPGFNVGYNAGDVGTLGIRGAFSFGNPTSVPEPGMTVLFGGAVLTVMGLRRRRKSAIA